MDITKKTRSLASLTTLIVLKAYLVWRTELNGHGDEMGELERVTNQEQWLLG